MRKGGGVCANELRDAVRGMGASKNMNLYAQTVLPSIQERLKVLRRHDRYAINRAAVHQLALDEAIIMFSRDLHHFRLLTIATHLFVTHAPPTLRRERVAKHPPEIFGSLREA